MHSIFVGNMINKVNPKLKFDVYHEVRQSSQLFSPDRFGKGVQLINAETEQLSRLTSPSGKLATS